MTATPVRPHRRHPARAPGTAHSTSTAPRPDDPGLYAHHGVPPGRSTAGGAVTQAEDPPLPRAGLPGHRQRLHPRRRPGGARRHARRHRRRLPATRHQRVLAQPLPTRSPDQAQDVVRKTSDFTRDDARLHAIATQAPHACCPWSSGPDRDKSWTLRTRPSSSCRGSGARSPDHDHAYWNLPLDAQDRHRLDRARPRHRRERLPLRHPRQPPRGPRGALQAPGLADLRRARADGAVVGLRSCSSCGVFLLRQLPPARHPHQQQPRPCAAAFQFVYIPAAAGAHHPRGAPRRLRQRRQRRHLLTPPRPPGAARTRG